LRRHGAPDEAFAKFYVDSIVHSKRTLEYLVDIVGHEHVLLGSDNPFDMGNLDCVKRVEEIDVPREQRDSILGGRAEVLLKLSLRVLNRLNNSNMPGMRPGMSLFAFARAGGLLNLLFASVRRGRAHGFVCAFLGRRFQAGAGRRTSALHGAAGALRTALRALLGAVVGFAFIDIARRGAGACRPARVLGARDGNAADKGCNHGQ
jgi:hypothetical protein